MLQITVPAGEFFNNVTQEFIYTKEQELKLEHSLVSISKWESKYKLPFLGRQEKTPQEMTDYIKFMTITQNVDPNVYLLLNQKHVEQIVKYINDPMTATTIRKIQKNSNNRTFVSSELIYYWMFSYNIPIECQKWHLNRLLTLIEIFNSNNNTEDKMSEDELADAYAKRNAEMRAKYQSKG